MLEHDKCGRRLVDTRIGWGIAHSWFGGTRRLSAGAGSLPSVATLEQAGAQLMLDAEASGDLQSRHPFAYALAADLRVADVEALLAAYKHLVKAPNRCQAVSRPSWICLQWCVSHVRQTRNHSAVASLN